MSLKSNTALELAAQGLPVFPVWWIGADGKCACGVEHPEGKNAGKHPLTPRGLNDASTDPALINEWWRIAPEANVGVAVPDGVVVVDCDPRNGGEETLKALWKEHGRFPDTRTVFTGGDGAHFYFRVPVGYAFPGKLPGGDGIDLKQQGGYVIAPPSNHASGKTYRWVSTPTAPIADAPAWVQALGWVRGDRSTVTVVDEDDRNADDATLGQIVALVEPHFVEGKKHHISKNLGGWLKQRGYGPGDVAYVVERLPSKDPRGRVKAAVAAFGIERAFGWTELKGLLGEAPAAALDAVTPNPRREGQTAELAGLVEAMAASAVEVNRNWPPPSAPTPQPIPPGQFPAWYVPVDLTETPPPIAYIVPDLELAPGRANMIVGYSNAGKSISTQALAFAIAMGLPAWGQFPTKRCRVLYLDAENIIVTRENFARLAYAHDVPMEEVRRWLTVVDSRFYMDAPNAEAEIACVIQREGYGAAFIDTFRASTPTLDENSKEVSLPLYMLGHVSIGTGAAIFVLHHEKKPDGEKRSSVEHMISGHASIHGALQVGLSLLRDDDSGLIAVRPSKRIRRGFDPFQLKIVDIGASGAAEAIAAGTSSPGVKVEYVSAKSLPPPVNENTLGAAITRILMWLRVNAADGRQVRVDTLLRTADFGGAGGKKAANLAAIERLTQDRQVHVSGSPKMIALVVEAAPYDPSSVAPPEGRPRLEESMNELGAALSAGKGWSEE